MAAVTPIPHDHAISRAPSHSAKGDFLIQKRYYFFKLEKLLGHGLSVRPQFLRLCLRWYSTRNLSHMGDCLFESRTQRRPQGLLITKDPGDEVEQDRQKHLTFGEKHFKGTFSLI